MARQDDVNKALNRLPPAERALQIAFMYGSYDGGHHKMWVIDQMVRALAGDKYDEWIKNFQNGEDGPNTYEWDVGIPP